jgi:GNAT superfamily N-acetyltransferase
LGGKIRLAQEDYEILSCYAVMAELRPHVRPEEFLARVKRQSESGGYKLAFLTDGEVKAVAGFRITEGLAWGKFLYLDDLVTKGVDRSRGYGGEMFDWLVEYARAEGCEEFHLNSRVQRFDAHRFYLNKRMFIECHHFALKLRADRSWNSSEGSYQNAEMVEASITSTEFRRRFGR